MQLTMKAPAKINLTLDVLGKREDGYHEVAMVMTQIDLSDRITLKLLPDPHILINSSISYLPEDHRNLAYQAAKLLQDRYHVRKGVHIFINKMIPISAGLAGGSSNAAATLKGLNELWELGLSIDELAKLGEELGSDVPFCVYGGIAMAKGRGEKITPLPPPPSFWVVLVKPPLSISTSDVYQKLSRSDFQQAQTPLMVEAIRRGDFEKMCSHLSNTLEAVTLRENPQVAYLKQQMLNCGSRVALMSGSGPTVYTLTSTQSRAQRIYNGLKGFCEQVFIVRSLCKSGHNT